MTRAGGVLVAMYCRRAAASSPATSALLRLDGWTCEDMTVVAPVGLVVQLARHAHRPRRRTRSHQRGRRSCAIATRACRRCATPSPMRAPTKKRTPPPAPRASRCTIAIRAGKRCCRCCGARSRCSWSRVDIEQIRAALRWSAERGRADRAGRRAATSAAWPTNSRRATSRSMLTHLCAAARAAGNRTTRRSRSRRSCTRPACSSASRPARRSAPQRAQLAARRRRLRWPTGCPPTWRCAR